LDVINVSKLLPAFQVETLNGLMEINSLAVNDLIRKHSRKCEGRKGIQKLVLDRTSINCQVGWSFTNRFF
jgi:hypothetical protein